MSRRDKRGRVLEIPLPLGGVLPPLPPWAKEVARRRNPRYPVRDFVSPYGEAGTCAGGRQGRPYGTKRKRTDRNEGGIFMASGQTSNYGLNQWAAKDKVLRSDFNQDNAKIDAALEGLEQTVAALPRLAIGAYMGTGTTTMSLSLPFKPEFVLIRRFSAQDEGAYIFGDEVSYQERETAGRAEVSNGDYYKVIRRNDGLSLVCNYTWEGDDKEAMVCNRLNVPYRYMALG